jgi:PDZ domain-containing protein
VLLVVVPVPFVNWTPGGTRDTLGSVDNEPMIKVQGIDTYPTTGRLDMTVVAITPADARLSLPQALLSYWLPHRDALPRDAVYAPGKTAEQVENEDADMMETAQDDAVVAALPHPTMRRCRRGSAPTGWGRRSDSLSSGTRSRPT